MHLSTHPFSSRTTHTRRWLIEMAVTVAVEVEMEVEVELEEMEVKVGVGTTVDC